MKNCHYFGVIFLDFLMHFRAEKADRLSGEKEELEEKRQEQLNLQEQIRRQKEAAQRAADA